MRRVEALRHAADDFGARGLREQVELVEGAAFVPAVASGRAFDADEAGALRLFGGGVHRAWDGVCLLVPGSCQVSRRGSTGDLMRPRVAVRHGTCFSSPMSAAA